MKCEILEQAVLSAIAPKRPKRKFKLFSRVAVSDRKNNATGKIVGCCWCCLVTGFEESRYPGWWYTVEIDGEQVDWHETELTKESEEERDVD